MADDADLKALRDGFSHDEAAWRQIREEGSTDMRYVSGDPWEPGDRADRNKHKRPCLSADELSQYTNQLINDVRMNKQAVSFSPASFGDNADQVAQFYGDKWREIEYRSKAQQAYVVAFQNCVERSFGFVRVTYRYRSAKSPNADIWIDAVHNPNLITPDADAVRPDLSDMTRCWVRERWDIDRFDRTYPKARVRAHQSDLALTAPSWVSATGVFLGEYWRIETTATKLHVFDLGQGDPLALTEDELDQRPEGALLVATRTVDVPRVIMQLTNGVEVLEETEWPGTYIPIIGCLGKVIYVESEGSQERRILSTVRLARDPQMLYAYLVTNEAEVIGAMPRFPYFVYQGQLDSLELERLRDSVTQPVAVIQVKAAIEGLPMGQVLPMPQRNPYEPPLQQIEIAKEAARRAIQAAMGQTPLPTAAQRRNEKSGVALKHMDELGQRGSFHFVDHYLDMITQVGVVGEDLLDKIYDTERTVPVQKLDGTTEQIVINAPGGLSTKGEHTVTVSAGPSFESERDQAADMAQTIMTSPIVLQAAGPSAPRLIAQAIKLSAPGVAGDLIAQILDPTLNKDQQQQVVPQLQAQVQQLTQQLQQMQPLADKNQAELMKAKMQTDADLQMKQADIASREKIALIQSTAQMSATQAKLDAENARTFVDAMENRLGSLLNLHMQRLTQVHEAMQSLQAQGHEQLLQRLQQAHEASQAALTPPDAGGGAVGGSDGDSGAGL